MTTTKHSKTAETAAHVLAVLTFVLICWVVHRSMLARQDCVNSAFVSSVRIGHDRFDNCIYQSRLNLNSLLHPISDERRRWLRAVEGLEALREFLPSRSPRLNVEFSASNPRAFDLGKGWIRLGKDWISNPHQIHRALVMGLLVEERPHKYASVYQLEVIADFLSQVVSDHLSWLKRNQTHDWLADLKFSTVSQRLADYCKSPFLSITHYQACTGGGRSANNSDDGAQFEYDEMDMPPDTWGYEPLLAVALWRVFSKVSLGQKLTVLRALRSGQPWSLPPRPPPDATAGRLPEQVAWFQQSLTEYLKALRFADDERTDWAMKSTLKELEVEAPLRWELTMDITNTPAWRDVLQQITKWSQFQQRSKRTLIFTPEGEVALPSGLPVDWSPQDIQSQIHVLIACQWPKNPGAVISVKARHLVAKQVCGKIEGPFWN